MKYLFHGLSQYLSSQKVTCWTTERHCIEEYRCIWMIFVAEATFGEFHPALLSFCLGVAGGLTQSPLSSTISTQNGVLYGWSSGLSPSYYIHIFYLHISSNVTSHNSTKMAWFQNGRSDGCHPCSGQVVGLLYFASCLFQKMDT